MTTQVVSSLPATAHVERPELAPAGSDGVGGFSLRGGGHAGTVNPRESGGIHSIAVGLEGMSATAWAEYERRMQAWMTANPNRETQC